MSNTSMTAVERKQWSAFSVFARWILISAIGWAAGLTVGDLLALAVAGISWINQDRFIGIATLVSLGFCLGIAQWIVLKQLIARPRHWVIATLIGFVLCLLIVAIGNLLRLGGGGILDDALLMALMGAVIGFSQWWILRENYRRAGWWILATAAGFLCFLVFVIHPASKPGEFILRGAIMGGFAAIATGVVLAWAARKNTE